MKFDIKLNFELGHKQIEEWIYASVIPVATAVIASALAYIYY